MRFLWKSLIFFLLFTGGTCEVILAIGSLEGEDRDEAIKTTIQRALEDWDTASPEAKVDPLGTYSQEIDFLTECKKISWDRPSEVQSIFKKYKALANPDRNLTVELCLVKGKHSIGVLVLPLISEAIVDLKIIQSKDPIYMDKILCKVGRYPYPNLKHLHLSATARITREILKQTMKSPHLKSLTLENVRMPVRELANVCLTYPNITTFVYKNDKSKPDLAESFKKKLGICSATDKRLKTDERLKTVITPSYMDESDEWWVINVDPYSTGNERLQERLRTIVKKTTRLKALNTPSKTGERLNIDEFEADYKAGEVQFVRKSNKD